MNIDQIMLGTAYWGSLVDEYEAFKLLDSYVESGGRYIDSATNYPIDGVADHFGLSLRILNRWIAENDYKELEIFVKIGSINNLGSSATDLKASTIHKISHYLQNELGENLHGLGIHWDNRGDNQRSEILETIDAMRSLKHQGYQIGISGISNLAAYKSEGADLAEDWEIQAKETLENQKSRLEYMKYFPNAKFSLYGLNAGGQFKKQALIGKSNAYLDKKTLDGISSIEYLSRIQTLLNRSNVSKIIVGPRKIDQGRYIFKRIK